MLYTKRKNYRNRWIIKLIESALIFGIIFFGMDAIHQMNARPHRSAVQVIVVQPQEVEAQIDNIEPEPVLDAFDYHRLGLEHHMSNEYNEAILDYSRAIALNEDIAASWLNRGVAYEQIGNRIRAMLDFNRFLQRDGMRIMTQTTVIDESMSAIINMSQDHMHNLPLNLRSGQVVNISVVSLEPDWVDTLIVLTDSQDRPIAANDDARRQDGSLISMNSYINNHEVTRNGEYTLHISHAGGGENGIRAGRIEIRITIDQ